ncbi:MAG: hypothetical protein JWN98_665, partial [Abditibacteriota bacterium]|nr:hypothetical protein [Abditibacteriota bacterium]
VSTLREAVEVLVPQALEGKRRAAGEAPGRGKGKRESSAREANEGSFDRRFGAGRPSPAERSFEREAANGSTLAGADGSAPGGAENEDDYGPFGGE